MDILFSCIGKTDPVKNFHDGAVLHIIRNYKTITKVILYMSKEIWDIHNNDDRYNLAFDDFKRRTNREFEVKYINSQIIDVDNYDNFFESFNEILKDIKINNPNSHIYLNASSGTPAMKTSILLLAVENIQKNVTPIQVTDPTYQSNIHKIEHQDNDILNQIINNQDNIIDINRCKVPNLIMFFKDRIKNQIKAMLENYNYEGALTIYNNYYEDIRVKLLIDHARKRMLLERENEKNIIKLKAFFNFDCYPIKYPDIEKIIEYALLIQTFTKTHMITEFLLRLNPFIIELQILYIQLKFKIDINNYKKYDKSFDIDKFKNDYNDIYVYLDEKFNPLKSSNISIQLLTYIIEYLDNDKENIKFFTTLNEINKKYRNSAAHELFSVSDNDLLNDPNIKVHSRKLMNDIWKFIEKTIGNHFPDDIINLYDRINNIIMENI